MKSPTHILQLEDNPNDTLLVQKLLEREGYVCDMMRVESRNDFVTALRDNKFDPILSDMKLPTLDGLTALQISRQMAPDIPFVIVSGTMGEDAAIDSLVNGATDYVLKRLFGLGKNELIGKTIGDLIDPGVRESTLEKIHAHYEGVHEILGMRSDGTRFVGELTSRNLTYRGISVRVMALRDITEQQQAENVVRASELRFRSVWEHSADGMRLTDYEGRIIEVNDAFCSLVQIPREQLVGQLFSVIYKRGGRDDDMSLYHDRFNTGKIVPHLLAPITLWNGEVRELELSNSFIDTGTLGKMILSVFRDITERKRVERESALLGQTLRSAKDCICVTDRENRILFVNESFASTYGYHESVLIGKDISIVWPSPESPGRYGEVHPASLQGGWHGELTNRRKDGTEFPMDRSQLHQALLNLCVNAREERYACIAVTDTGAGMDAAVREKTF